MKTLLLVSLLTLLGCGSQLVELENRYYQCVSAKAGNCDPMAAEIELRYANAAAIKHNRAVRLARRCNSGGNRCYDMRSSE